MKQLPATETLGATSAINTDKTGTLRVRGRRHGQDEAAYKTAQTKPINQILALIYTLLALAVVIALIGIGQHPRPVDLRTHP